MYLFTEIGLYLIPDLGVISLMLSVSVYDSGLQHIPLQFSTKDKIGCTGAFCQIIQPLTVALCSTKTIAHPASLYCLIIAKHISLPVLVSCLQSSLARESHAENQVSQSAKGAQPVH